LKKNLWLIGMILGVALLGGCGKKDAAEADKPGGGKTTTTKEGGSAPVAANKQPLPPAEHHKSDAPPSPEMKGEWVLEPSERQRVIDARLIALGKKPQTTELKIEGGQFELHIKAASVETTIKGDAKQEGDKITLTAKSSDSTMDGKPLKARVPGPQIFTLQADQLTIKDSQGLVYVRK
jgi:hypothetical protein